jgi:predicted DCC family thiol-disulfide oxidoreductase YuxK
MPPDHPIVVFDGVCNFCSGTVQFILKHDRAGCIRFAPLQSPAGRSLLARNGIDPGDADTLLLITDKGAFTRSDAALELARRLGWWKWVWMFKLIPRTLRDAIYAALARHRYAWFGKKDSCFAPGPEERARFMDDLT